jgi:hypothetical protein
MRMNDFVVRCVVVLNHRMQAMIACKPWENDVAKGQMRSNKEKKKPKADKSKKKDEAPGSPFAAARVPGKPGYAGKKT